MAASSSNFIYLDGVDFKLSDAFMVHRKIELPLDFDLKDPDVLLEDFEYDFSTERSLLAVHRAKEQELEERQQREVELKKRERERGKHELAEKHRLFKLQKEREEMENSEKEKAAANASGSSGVKMSANNPFYDLVSDGILKPQQYTDDKHDTPQQRQLDVHEFENENQDPFSNMELQSIDDLKELQDVLQHVTMSGLASTTTTRNPNPAPRVRHHSPSNVIEEVSVKMTKRSDNDAGVPSRKKVVLDELTDLLTSDVKDTENSSDEEDASNSLPLDVAASQSPQPIDQRQQLSSPNVLFLPPITNNSLPSLFTKDSPRSQSPTFTQSSLPNPQYGEMSNSSINHTPQTSDMEITEVIDLSLRKSNRLSPEFHSNSNVSVNKHTNDTATSEHEYQNLPFQNKPKTKPKPLPRISAAKSPRPRIQDSQNDRVANSDKPLTYGAVKDKVLSQKSASEKAKFEETINKALTSLPQLPRAVNRPRDLERETSPDYEVQRYTTPYPPMSTMPQPAIPISPGLLNGLQPEERNFAQSVISMGFKEQDVIRTMQKYGQDHKEVLDHLCLVQRLSEKGFATCNIEEALDVFNGNETETAEYLLLEQQFLDMGFSSEKIKQALLLHNRDQSKALEELMSTV